MADSIPPLASAPYREVTSVFLEGALMTVIRHEKKTLADLRDIFDTSFTALAEAVKSGWVIPTGPAYAVYHGDPQGTFDLEVGFPALSAPTADIPTTAGTIHASALPAGNAAILTHVGSYAGLGDTWGTLMASTDTEHRGVWIEAYVADPSSTADADLRTDLILPLR
ncbi:GyrI-like domain-containing protein [Microbacterium dauci]|uniref:GyrI-like domain-containing protein n=1 Tax=Microbacterium dauci TaxID=3048008 RepID=A0ABT6ZGZ4_9MICO|nr:GyrI-like domain-containing protein [Microbacterium sp. LX3-4]MDJ1115261.1 GyrI-like domain-containing protein [Microbacterium sp. LX3-4]